VVGLDVAPFDAVLDRIPLRAQGTRRHSLTVSSGTNHPYTHRETLEIENSSARTTPTDVGKTLRRELR
jgi:hypothetical protein